jgi:hypothetical protein
LFFIFFLSSFDELYGRRDVIYLIVQIVKIENYHLNIHTNNYILRTITNMSSTTKPNKPRRHIADLIGGQGFSHARVRRHIDKHGVNQAEQDKIQELNVDLLKLNKLGGPAHPGAPIKKPVKDATDADKLAYETAVAERKTAFSLWRDYESPEYKKVYTVYQVVKHLGRLMELLNKTSTKKTQEDIAAELRALDDLPPAVPSRHEGETDEKYKIRLDKHKADVEKFVAPGFKALVGDIDLKDVNSIAAHCTKLRADFPDLVKLLTKDDLSHKKIRFNDEGLISVTAGCEEIVGELVHIAMRNATDDGKRIIQPDHIIMNDDVFKSPMYCLYRSLPHFVALAERHKRQVTHEQHNREKRQALFRDARAKARTAGHTYTKADSPDLSVLKNFEDDEVEKGFAVKRETQVPRKGGKTGHDIVIEYLWKGIDLNDPELSGTQDSDAINFDHYVYGLCQRLKKTALSDIAVAESVKVSKSIKQFMSKLVIDFLARLAGPIRILLQYSDAKTVDKNVVVTAYKMMLSENYIKSDGNIAWSVPHETFFNTIDAQADAWKTASKAGSQPDDTDLDMGLDELDEPTVDDDDESEPSTPPASAAAPVQEKTNGSATAANANNTNNKQQPRIIRKR